MNPRLDSSSEPPTACWQRAHRLLGFHKSYNFLLWLVFVLALLGIAFSRAAYLDYFGVFCRSNYLSAGFHAAPGECYYFLNGGREQIGMMLHIYSVVPCSALLFFQFVPAIRQRLLIWHRINGYVVLMLMTVAIVGGLMAASGSFGGDPAFMACVISSGVMVATALTISMINVKKLQIEQHRAWMLRAWAWAFSIITMRVLQQVICRMVSGRGYAIVRPCAQIASDGVMSAFDIQKSWPACEAYFSGQTPEQTVLVDANYYGLPIEINVALSLASGASVWLALLVHAMGVELYLNVTPAESERLRHISYHKQLAAGMRSPGSAGLTVDRFGDAVKWCPQVDKILLDGHVAIDQKKSSETDSSKE